MPGVDRPVLILSDHVAVKVRLRDAMAPYARVECVVSEHELLQRLARPVRLIVIHGVPPFSDPRLPARLRHALGELPASIVVVTHSREPAWQSGRTLIASGQVEDIIYMDTERVDALVAAWSLDSDRCRQKVEALRLARESAPENLHVFLEELLLKDTGDLSVGAWAAKKSDGSRFALHRELAKIGVSPSTLVDVARVLNVVTRVLVRGGTRLKGRLAALPDVRAARRLLARTLGMSPSDVTHLAREQGPDAVRDRTREAVSKMLGGGGAHPEGTPRGDAKE
ncbi:MAG: hypothetical protein Q8K55_00205 [Gemmatimonadaceae bacterium]|nr:hypothetical protein [Gemmatimonadaceae bacterium]